MLKEHISFFRKLEMLADLSLAGIAFYAWYPYSGYSPILPWYLLIWAGLLHLTGLYESFRVKQVGDILLTIWSSAFIGVGAFGAAAYLLKYQDLSRFFVILTFFSAAALISLEKMAAMIFFRRLRTHGYNFRNVLIVGTGKRVEEFIRILHRHDEWGLRIAGLVDEDASLRGTRKFGYTVLGTLDNVADIVHENVVDEVVFIVPRAWHEKIEKIVAFCEMEGIRIHNAIDVFELKFAKAKQTDLDGFQLLTFERAPIRMWHRFFKGVLDVVISGVLLVLLAPLFALIAVAIRMTSKGPAFYRQQRCGLHGRKFTLYKFRTMVENAEAQLPELLAGNEMQGPVFKMENDPRITPIGKFLRKFSLDELPQLWNVFRRDMSLVGPRPPLPDEVRRYDSWQRRRLSMRPGITCLWQVNGRNRISDFNEWTRLDLQYIDHWSVLGDLKILLQTIPAVVFGIGSK